jgi:hypothetical protein
MKELSLLAREWRDAAVTRRACLLGERLGHVLVLKLIIKATEGERSSIDLPEYDVERADDRRDVGKMTGMRPQPGPHQLGSFIRSHASALSSGLHQRTQNNGATPAAFAYLGILRP